MKRFTFSISFALGSLFSSLLVNWFGRRRSASFFLTVIGLTQVFTFYSQWILFLTNSLKGLSSGALFTTLIVWIINIWQKRCSAFLQTLMFFIFLAKFLEPIVQKQYIFVIENVDTLGCYTTAPTDSSIETTFNELLPSYFNSTLDIEKNITTIFNESYQKLSEKSCNKFEEYISRIPQICIGFLTVCGKALIFILHNNHKQHIKTNQIQLKSKKRLNNRIFGKRFSIESLKTWKRSFFVISISLLLTTYLTIEFSNIKLLSIYSQCFDNQSKGMKPTL